MSKIRHDFYRIIILLLMAFFVVGRVDVVYATNPGADSEGGKDDENDGANDSTDDPTNSSKGCDGDSDDDDDDRSSADGDEADDDGWDSDLDDGSDDDNNGGGSSGGSVVSDGCTTLIEEPKDNCSVTERISLAVFPNDSGLGDAKIKYFARGGEENLASIENIKLNGSLWMRIKNEADQGQFRVYTIVQASGSTIRFRIPLEFNHSSDDMDPYYRGGFIIGRPIGGEAFSQAYITFVSFEGIPTTAANADLIRQYRAPGGYVEYPIGGGYAIRMMSEEGRLWEYSEQPVTVVVKNLRSGKLEEKLQPDLKRESIRQIRTPAGLLDVIVENTGRVVIRKYAPSQIKERTGLVFSTEGDSIESMEVDSPEDVRNEVTVAKRSGSFETLAHSRVELSDGDEVWTQTLTMGDFSVKRVLERQLRPGQPDFRNFKRTYSMLSAPGNFQPGVNYEIGGTSYQYRPIEVKEVLNGSITTIDRKRDYVTPSWDQGGTGRVVMKTTRSGDALEYTYDDDQRMTSREQSFAETSSNQRKLSKYFYHGVDGNDLQKLVDYRPRKTELSIDGVVVGTTYYAYYLNNDGEYVARKEEAVSPDALYGDLKNRVIQRTYYAANVAERGRLKSSIRRDGTMTQYQYEMLPDYELRLTKTSRLNSSGVPVEGKSRRIISTKDSRGWPRLEIFGVYTGGEWVNYQQIDSEYNSHGMLTFQKRTDLLSDQTRVLLEQEWDGYQLIRRVDEFGVATSMKYNQRGQLIESRREAIPATGVYPAQPEIITKYTGDFQITSGKLPTWKRRVKTVSSGNLAIVSTEHFDGEGRIVSKTDQDGYTTTYEYSDNTLVTKVTLPNGGNVITTRAPDGKLVSRTGTSVISEFFSYSPVDGGGICTTSYTSILGGPRFSESKTDSLGRLILHRRPAFGGLVRERRFEYNINPYCGPSRIATTGHATELFEYDSLCDLVRSGHSADNNTLELDSSTDQVSDSDALVKMDSGKLWFVRTNAIYPDAESSTVKVTREVREQIGGFTGNEHKVREVIDIVGNVTLATVEINRSTKMEIETLSSPGFETAEIKCKHASRLVSVLSPGESKSTDYLYDALGRLVGVNEPRYSASKRLVFHSGSNLVARSIDASGNVTTYEYGDQGERGAAQVVLQRRADGSTFRMGYDLLDRKIRSWGTAKYPSVNHYNEYGERIGETTYRNTDGVDLDAIAWPLDEVVGDFSSWDYEEGTGLLLQKRDAKGKGCVYAYNVSGMMVSRTWERGVLTSYTYDDFNRLQSVVYSNDPANTKPILVQYDRIGRKKSVGQGAGSSMNFTSYSYDASSLLLTKENYSYAGGLVQRSVTRDYDSFLRIRQVNLLNGGTVEHSQAYEYDAESRFSKVHSEAGVFIYEYSPTDRSLLTSIVGPSHRVDMTYEDNRDVLSIYSNRRLSDSSVISSYKYVVDEVFRRTKVVNHGSAFESPRETTWGYNLRDEVVASDSNVVGLQGLRYSYDSIGNRVSTTEGQISTNYVVNSSNEYSLIGGSASNHDGDGNAISMPLPNDLGANSQLVWDGENRLVGVLKSNGTVLSYQYDASGRRIRVDEGLNDRYWAVYDGVNMIAEVADGSEENSQRLYTWGLDMGGRLQGGGGVGGLLAVDDGAEVVFPTFDGNGNVCQYLDAAGHSLVHYEYDSFGNILISNGVETDNFRHKFSTKIRDVSSGLLYYGGRYYNSLTGRWLSRDPVSEFGGLMLRSVVLRDDQLAAYLLVFVYSNSYLFVGNSPLNVIDPNGEFPLLAAAIGAAVGAVVGSISGGLKGGLKGALSGAVGGAVGGAVLGATGSPALAGAAAGAAGSVTGQLLNKQNPFTGKNLAKTAASAGIGAGAGALGGALAGATGGALAGNARVDAITNGIIDASVGVAGGLGNAISDMLFDLPEQIEEFMDEVNPDSDGDGTPDRFDLSCLTN